VTFRFGNRKFMQPMGMLTQHALMNDPVFSFLRGGIVIFLFSSLVPNVFP
jgi:hypothetical protein